MGAVFDDDFSSVEATGGVNVHQGEERAANDLLCCLYNSQEPLLVCNGATAVPYSMSAGSRWMSGRRTAVD